MNLLERQDQLDELSHLLREAGKSAGKIALLRGEAGAGKSALVEEFTQQAARSAAVFWGHSDALQTSRVLGPVNELLTSVVSASGVQLASDLSREQRFALLLERFSPPNPLSVVVLEDLHWADEATLDFVRFLGRRIQRTRCLLIATYRDDEITPTHLLRGVLGEIIGQHTARIRVPALSLNAVEQLARGTPHDARQVYEVTNGNPFFVRELLSVPADTVPETVRDVVLTRLLQCSAEARGVAEVVSLLPGRTELRLILAMLGDVGAAADEAVERGLLRYLDGALSFRHELGRLAVESTIAHGRAQSLHQNLLRRLIEQDADLSRLVHHASHAQDIEALLEYAPRAAEQAAKAGAHREAISYLSVALRHVDALSAVDSARLFELHATECNVTNRVAAALESGSQALARWRELGDVHAQARVLVLLSRQYWKSGQYLPAERHVCQAIALLETLPPTRDLAMTYSSRSQLAMTSDDTEQALEFAQRAYDLATQFADHSIRAHALNNLGTALLNSGNAAGAEKLEQSLAIALENNLHEDAGRAYSNLVSSALRQHIAGVPERYLAEGLEYCEVHEVQDNLSYLRAQSARYELDRGRWDKAAQAAAELIERHQLAPAQRVPALITLSLLRARRGDPGVDALLDEALKLALPTEELQRVGKVASARAEVAWYRGDLQRVAEEAAVGLRFALDSRDPWIPGELAFWARRADPSVRIPATIAKPYALMIAGEWELAAGAWEALSAPYERALALALGPEEALRESLAILQQLGAGPLAAIVQQRLRDLGARSIPRGPRASTRENPAGLTPREVQVLTLLVHGHTNSELARRLHLSAKTVDHHVSAILQKLGVHSRTEAVTAAFRLGIVKATKDR